MKDNKKKFAAALAMITATAAAIHALNRYIEKAATAGNLLSGKNCHTFHWRLGDISYTRTGSGSPVPVSYTHLDVYKRQANTDSYISQ